MPGRLVFKLLAFPVRLLFGTAAHVVGQEAAGGDAEPAKRQRAGVNYYALGFRPLNLDTSSMEPQLTEKGYPLPTVRGLFRLNGGGGYGVIGENKRLLLDAEGGGGSYVDAGEQYGTFAGGGQGFLNVGYLFRLTSFLRAYPLLGLGAGGLGLTVAETDPEREDKPSPDREKKVGMGGGGILLHVGLGLELRLGGKTGLILGLRVGIAFHPLKILMFGAGVGGPFVRFIAGLGRFADETA
jgi:hypothetical protein